MTRAGRSASPLLAAGVLTGLLVVLGVLLADPLVAQEPVATGGPNLRAYRFVFLAYAVAWILVFGWIWAVARRLARLDHRLRD